MSASTSTFLVRLVGYESPCGFMSCKLKSDRLKNSLLRIPMWVYETEVMTSMMGTMYVTNPHVGL